MKIHRLIAVIAVLCAGNVSAEDKPAEIRTLATPRESTVPAVEIRFRIRLDDPLSKHEYTLHYQFRVHTKKGELGPVLGDATLPNGRAYEVGTLKHPKGNGWEYDLPGAPPLFDEAKKRLAAGLEFDGTIDVTRRELSLMSNLPKDAAQAIIRVEPHVFDETAKKFVTPGKSRAPVLFLELKGGQVVAMRLFEDWFPLQFETDEKAKAATQITDDLDRWDASSSFVPAFEKVLQSERIPPGRKALAVRALPINLARDLRTKFPSILAVLAKSDNADLKAAVAEKVEKK